jgi:hypothetical protein
MAFQEMEVATHGNTCVEKIDWWMIYCYKIKKTKQHKTRMWTYVDNV